MPYQTTADALALELAAVPGIGHVHVTEKHLRDRARIKALFAVDPALPDDKAIISGCTINRETIAEDWETTLATYATETWVIRLYRGLESKGSETAFNDLLDAVKARLRPLKSLGDLEILSAARTAALGTARLRPWLCHYSELVLTAGERFTIPTSPTIPAPAHFVSVAAPREATNDVGAQLAGYLADLGSQVHVGRRLITSREDVLEDLTVEAEGLPEGQRDIRVLQIYRRDDAEDAGVALRVETESAWSVQAAWQWADAVDSGRQFQDYIDTLRARVRSYANLGNARNPTMCESSPLQVKDIGARTLGGHLVHFADCEIGIRELVYA